MNSKLFSSLSFLALTLLAFQSIASERQRESENNKRDTANLSSAAKSDALEADKSTMRAQTGTTAERIENQSQRVTSPALIESVALLAATASPNAGEQINWQVIGGGGGRGVSASLILNGTVGQIAAGPGSSTNFKINQGFWQNFTTSCCVGKRGNVNCTGTIDLGDLSALVSYLTGGGFVLCCYDAANVNGVGAIDLGDLSALVSYLTGGGFVLVNCP